MKRNVLMDGNGSDTVMIEGLGPYVPMSQVRSLQAENEARREDIALHQEIEAKHLDEIEALKAEAERLQTEITERDRRAYIISPQVFEDALKERDQLKIDNECLQGRIAVAGQLISDCTEVQTEFDTSWDLAARKWLEHNADVISSHDAAVIERFVKAYTDHQGIDWMLTEFMHEQANQLRQQAQEVQS